MLGAELEQARPASRRRSAATANEWASDADDGEVEVEGEEEEAGEDREERVERRGRARCSSG